MSLTGILLDVSWSMQKNIGSGIDEEGGPWAQSIFNVIDDLIEHELTSENRVFAIGVGAECPGKEIFDVIETLQPNQNTNRPATEDHINEILDILEGNGARNIRKWTCKTDVKLIQNLLSDYMAKLTLQEFKSDEQFVKKFVDEFLPRPCRDAAPTTPHAGVLFGLRKVANGVGNATIWTASCFRSATREEIEEVVRKTKFYLEDSSRVLKTDVETSSKLESTPRILKDVGTHSIFSVQDAPLILKDVGIHSIFSVQDVSRIIRRCVGEKGLNELSKERKQELLKNVEPFIYGRTPLYESLEKAIELFEGDASKTKLLFVLSDGLPTDGNNQDSIKIKQITSKLREEKVNVVSCFISTSTNIDPKRLYNKIPPIWEPGGKGWVLGAKLMFSLSSKVSTQHLPRAILVKRGWTIDVGNNETKLFMQVNHPDNLREACKMAKDVVCSADTLSELLVSVDLDIYISQTTSDFKAKEQQGGTCYANASATVLHLAMQRILGREGGYPDFHKLKDEMIKAYGINGANTSDVLQEICPNYRLHSQNVYIKGAMEAVVKKRPVVVRFRLTVNEWMDFSNFYKTNPTGILTQNELDVRKRPKNPPPRTSGHAVVLTSYNSKCLTFMNSWGQKWGDKGFFRVQNAEVLQLEFFDVYWTLNDLTEGEKEYYHQHGSEVAAKLMNSLKGLQKAEYTCPECEQPSLVTEFAGTLSKVQCPKCLREFSTNDNAGNILALNMYLISLSK